MTTKTAYSFRRTRRNSPARWKRSRLRASRTNSSTPAFATFTAPPAIPSGQAAIWDGASWSLTSDIRGTVAYEKSSGAQVVVNDLGPLSDALTLTAPKASTDKWDGSAWIPRITQFDTWNGSQWVTDIAALKTYQISLIMSQQDSKAATLRLSYIPSEAATWPQQIAEANAFLAGGTPSTPLLDALAAARSIDEKTLAQKIVAKAAAYATALAKIIAETNSRVAAVKAATAVQAIQAA